MILRRFDLEQCNLRLVEVEVCMCKGGQCILTTNMYPYEALSTCCHCIYEKCYNTGLQGDLLILYRGLLRDCTHTLSAVTFEI